MRDSIRFLMGGQVVELAGFRPSETVLDYLRRQPDRRGTKEGCSEGDCGACTVVLGELDGNDCLQYRAYNACILFLAALDGKQLVTVEDLQDAEGGLHPVQSEMVHHHGAQCGFCTPGFVMSLFAMYQQNSGRAPTRAEIDEGLAGNLCRCTGYAPIVRAAESSLLPGRQDGYAAATDRTREQLRSLRNGESLAVAAADERFFAPRSTAELEDLLQQYPGATLVAGATDVGLWVTKQLEDLPVMISTAHVGELRTLETNERAATIGAAVSYTDARPVFAEHYPSFDAMIERLGAMQVRNAGTVGGNIANGSPIGDMPPGLIALDARLIIGGPDGRRELALEDFFLTYGRQDLRDGEYVHAVRLPLPVPGQHFRIWKVSKRFEQDISAVCAAFNVVLRDGRVETARLAYGGMAGTPQRARHAEACLQERDWDADNVRRAIEALQDDFTPLTDLRASAEYRLAVAGSLLWRFFLETSGAEGPFELSGKYGEAAHV